MYHENFYLAIHFQNIFTLPLDFCNNNGPIKGHTHLLALPSCAQVQGQLASLHIKISHYTWMTCSICPHTYKSSCSSCYTSMFLGLILPIFGLMFCVHSFSKTTNSDTVCQLAINSLIVAVSIHIQHLELRKFANMYYREALVIGWFLSCAVVFPQ